MKIGIVLPSYLYNDTRRNLADVAFRTLATTKPLDPLPHLLLLVKSGTTTEYQKWLDPLSKCFQVHLKTDEGLHGTEQTLAYGSTRLIQQQDVDYVTWMGDDAEFNSNWLLQLEGLIQRHPEARAWSVYRSSYEWIHRTLAENEQDVLVRSICGHGMTFSAKEWLDWGIQWEVGSWGCSYGDTLDLVHWETREGERWVTKNSYVAHTGRLGNHCDGSQPEYARNFLSETGSEYKW